MPAGGRGDLPGVPGSLFRDWFRASLAGERPPAGFQLWGYKLVRSDRRAGGGLRWPDRDEVLVETKLSDGYRDGETPPGLLAVTPEIARVAHTSSVGGSVLITVAYSPGDVAGERDGGLVLVRRAYVADADVAGANLDSGIFQDERYRALDAVDAPGLRDRERASFLGPEPLEHPGLDSRPRTRLPRGDWLAVAVGLYRQPPNDPYDLALALSQVAGDEAARKRLAEVHLHASILRHALPWERQVAVQRRVDGYLLEQFGRADPRREDPERPMGRAEQWLHRFPYGPEFLNLAETLIEYDIGYDELAAGPLPFTQRLLPRPRALAPADLTPGLAAGPAYRIYGGPGDHDTVPRWPELTAAYLPASGEPRLIRLEANGPCSPREQQRLLGGPVTRRQLDSRTRLLTRNPAPRSGAVNAAATALLSRYPAAGPAVPVRGNAVIAGRNDDDTDGDVPGIAIRHLAGLGHQVASP